MPTLRHTPLRPAMLDLIARAGSADPAEDEGYFLDQLRAALAGEGPADRLWEAYGHACSDRLGRLYARYPE